MEIPQTVEISHIKRSKTNLEKILKFNALIIAGIPVMIYLMVYVYNSGFLKSFGLPITFMPFNLSFAYKIGSVFIVIISYIILELLLTNLQIRKTQQIFYKKFVVYITLFCLLITKIFSYRPIWYEYFYYIFLFMTAVFVIDILCASLLIPGKRNIFYKWKLVENLRNDNISISQNIDYWLKRLIIDYRSMITYLVIILLVIYVSGRSDALGQDYHYVVNTKPERVVLWMTEDYSICSLYGKQTHIVDPNYIILKNGDDTSIEFTLEKTGRLQPSGNIFSFTILGD